MEESERSEEGILVAFPCADVARRAIACLARRGLAARAIEPPEALRDVGVPALWVDADRAGEIDLALREEGIVYVGRLARRDPAGPVTDRFPRLEAGACLVEEVRWAYVAPCFVDETKLRFIAYFDRDLSEVLPYLNALIRSASYDPATPSLGFRLGDRQLALYATKVAAGKVGGIVDAWWTLAQIKDRINDAWRRRDAIEPCFELRERPRALEIFKRLPGSNCGLCGERSCLAFAAKLSVGDAVLARCTPLFAPENDGRRRALRDLYPGLA